MSKVRAAAIYARISSDPTGQALGVQRQLEDCRRLATDRGWTVAEEYVDNDLSAFSGKQRPQYARMIADIEAGARDAVVVYNLDRLTRRPIELEQFAQICEAAGVRQVATVTADIDLGNDDGLFMARIFAAFAAKESARKSARVKRRLQQVAEQGLPHGGSNRAFGYAEDKVTVVESEAVVVRTLAERFIAGESLRSLATWLDEAGVRTVAGGPWKTTTLRAMLASGRIAGLREHQGQVVGPAAWAPIITQRQRQQILAQMERKKVSGRRAPRRYLLSGLLRCGKCGTPLYSSARVNTRRYVCLSGPDHGGCGGITVVAAPVEALIAETVLRRLDSPELIDALNGHTAADEHQQALAEQLQADQEQLSELAEMFGHREITAPEWKAAREPVEARIRTARQQLAAHSQHSALAGLAGGGSQLRGQWAELNLDRQHAIVAAVLDHAVILPAKPEIRTFDMNRVQPVWRL